MEPVSLLNREFWKLPDACLRAQQDAERIQQGVQSLGARMPVIGYADIPRTQRPTFAVREEQEEKARHLLGEQQQLSSFEFAQQLASGDTT